MDRNLALEMARVTEAAALSSARLMGRGDSMAADQAAVDSMRRALNSIPFDGTVVIGEGERDEAPMLYIGEKVGCGNGSVLVDIALDPLEGTNLCAYGSPGSISVVAIAEHGQFLHAPDTYMEKIAVGPIGSGKIDINQPVSWNLQRLAKAKNCHMDDLTVIILDRPRHGDIIAEVRRCGARIKLIQDGDVAAAIATCTEETGIDMLIGTGGAPEGVLAAAALRCVGGDMQGRLAFRNDEEKARALKMGIKDLNKVFQIDELAAGDVMFAATGVTTGDFLKGVRFFAGGAETHSVVMRSKTKTIRFIEAVHHFETKPIY
ncbi:MAG: class II fructose-bisphosphatase [Deltaproteobacteria bacterium]|nr:class II fructose-bisphosphatase [Deltaproteobacteria bacterium]